MLTLKGLTLFIPGLLVFVIGYQIAVQGGAFNSIQGILVVIASALISGGITLVIVLRLELAGLPSPDFWPERV